MTESILALLNDVRYAWRSIRRDRLITIVIVATLGLGIGANATIFGIIDRLLLQGPSHITRPDEIRRFYFMQRGWRGVANTSTTGYVTYTTLQKALQNDGDVAAYNFDYRRLDNGPAADVILTGWSTWDMFPLLGVRPALGRFYNQREDRPGAASNVAVISYELWQSRYGGASSVIGRDILLSDAHFTVIGVAPRGFTGPELSPIGVWTPMSVQTGRDADWSTSWCCTWLQIVMRKHPGLSDNAVSAAATAAYRAAAAQGKDANASTGTVSLLPLRYTFDAKEDAETSVARWLMGVSIAVLLIACANVTNLLLARSVRRRREIVIRLAMGVSRFRLARLLLSESLLLGLAGGLAALIIAVFGARVIHATLLPGVLWDTTIDARTLAFTASLTIGAGIVVGLLPILRAGRVDLATALKGATRASMEPGGASIRKTLTIVQAALSVVLLIGAALFVKSVRALNRVDLGIDADKVITVTATTSDTTLDLYRSLADRLRTRPDVASTALAIGMPFEGDIKENGLRVQGFDSLPAAPGGGPFMAAVSTEYFKTVGTPIVRGRDFTQNDAGGSENVVIVNETMANILWPHQDPLTKCITLHDAACARVIGVARDVRRHLRDLRESPSMQYYMPITQRGSAADVRLVVRPRGAAASFIPNLQRALYEEAPATTYFRARVLSGDVNAYERPWHTGAILFLVFGAVALCIAAMGLYSLVAYAVAQRRMEFGIRMALGAETARISRLVFREGLTLACSGIAAGVVIALLLGRSIQPLLFNTPGRDPVALSLVSIVLFATAALACLIPALRASRVNPIEVLRSE